MSSHQDTHSKITGSQNQDDSRSHHSQDDAPSQVSSSKVSGSQNKDPSRSHHSQDDAPSQVVSSKVSGSQHASASHQTQHDAISHAMASKTSSGSQNQTASHPSLKDTSSKVASSKMFGSQNQRAGASHQTQNDGISHTTGSKTSGSRNQQASHHSKDDVSSKVASSKISGSRNQQASHHSKDASSKVASSKTSESRKQHSSRSYQSQDDESLMGGQKTLQLDEVNSLREEILSGQLSPSQSEALESKHEEILEEKEELPDDDDDVLDMLSNITGNHTKASSAQSRYQEELSELSQEMEHSSSSSRRQEEPSISILKSAHASGLKSTSTSKVENRVSQSIAPSKHTTHSKIGEDDEEISPEDIFSEIKVARTENNDNENAHTLQSFVISKTFSSENVVVLLNLKRTKDGEWVLDKTIAQGLRPETYGGVVSIDQYDFVNDHPNQQDNSSLRQKIPEEGAPMDPANVNVNNKNFGDILKRLEDYVSQVNQEIKAARELMRNSPVCKNSAPSVQSLAQRGKEAVCPLTSCEVQAFDELPFVDKIVRMFHVLVEEDQPCNVCYNESESETNDSEVSSWLRSLMLEISSFCPSMICLKGDNNLKRASATAAIACHSQAILEEVKKSGLLNNLSKSGLITLQQALSSNPSQTGGEGILAKGFQEQQGTSSQRSITTAFTHPSQMGTTSCAEESNADVSIASGSQACSETTTINGSVTASHSHQVATDMGTQIHESSAASGSHQPNSHMTSAQGSNAGSGSHQPNSHMTSVQGSNAGSGSHQPNSHMTSVQESLAASSIGEAEMSGNAGGSGKISGNMTGQDSSSRHHSNDGSDGSLQLNIENQSALDPYMKRNQ